MRPNAEFLKDFVEEASLHIATVENLLLRLERGEYTDDAVNEIFRAVHSIKGAAGLFELTRIAELSHTMETLFGAVRDKSIVLSAALVDSVFVAADLLKDMIGRYEESDTRDISATVDTLKTFLPAQDQSPSEATGNLWDLWDKALGTAVPGPTVKTPDQPVAVIPPSDGDDRLPVRGTHEDSVRVGVGVLNDLLTLAGEMVLRRNQLLRLVENGGRVEELQSVAKGIDLVTTALQEKIMKARMQPVANLFNKFPRIVRELSRKLDKEIDLRIEGAHVELDKSIIEALSDPLVHIVRNAIDHGIEQPGVRKALQKPYNGRITLRAYHEAGKVIIEAEDDGAGIDPAVIAAKAIERGIIGERQLAEMSEREIVHLIMRPGFSTADTVTELSGRGVGMDVVRTNIEKIGGKIEIVSTPGHGSIFRLSLPLTLAIIPALIVSSGDFTAAIPQANLHELVLLQPDDEKRRLELVQGYPVLRLRDRLLPLLRLTDIIGQTQPGLDSGIDEYFLDSQRTFRIVVLKCGRQIFALEVDHVYDHEEILVKPLPPNLQECNYYMGSTVLGDGRIAIILDPEEIKNQSDPRFGECELAEATTRTAAVPAASEQQEMLLFKAAGGEVLAIDVTLVSRVEIHQESELQKIRSKEYVVSRGKPLRIVRPEYYLPITRTKKRGGDLNIIIPKLVRQPLAIVAREIIGIVKADVVLSEDGPGGSGLIGSALIDGQLVLLLNIYELFDQVLPGSFGSAAGNSSGKAPSARVLLVEDLPVFAKVTKGYLEGAGLEVLLAADGQQALAVLARETVDLVISDIEMPVMNGFELIRAIRADANLRSLPVIALTSLTGEVNRDKGLRAGFDAYEYKLDRVKLLSTAERYLRRAK